jgi:ketosteroid isomerase-like protein
MGVQENVELVRRGFAAFSTGDMERSGGTFAVTLLDLAGSGDRVYALQHSHGEREGRVLDRDAVNIFQVTDDVATEVREFFEDTAESDAFWD